MTRMTRVLSLRVWALLPMLLLPTGCREPVPSRDQGPIYLGPPPNILVIVVDDLRWDDIGVAGHPFVQTPAIDRLAREGALFENAFVTTPLCSPGRASILTGLYPHAHGITDNTDHSVESHQLPTFARDLQRAGYTTGFVGTWHMGNDETRRPGFDYWAALRGPGEAIDPFLNDGVSTTRVEGYVTDVLTDRAVAFLEQPHDGPFMLFLAHTALHPNARQLDDGSTAAPESDQPTGFIPAERHRGIYADATIPRRLSSGVPPLGKPALERQIDDLPPLGPDTITTDRTIRERLEMLLAVDDSVARLTDTLRQAGELDNTIIIFTSDHGYFYGEHGLSAERRLAYEETLRIPLIVRFPPLVRPGSRIGPLSLSIDVAPTLLDLADIEPDHPLHGRSLLPVLVGRAPGWRSAFLVEYYSDTEVRRIRTMGYQAVRADRYKYIHYTDLDGMDELYDLVADPFEMKNLMVDPAQAETLAVMQAELERLLEETR